jgi:hypothetical protein
VGLERLYVEGFWALAAFAELEAHFLALMESTSAGAFDVGEVDEDVIPVWTGDESEALLIVEELHCTFEHCAS